MFVKKVDKYKNMCYNNNNGGRVMKSYSSREVIAKLKSDGWYLVAVEGSHHQYKHSDKPGKVTVKHPCKDIPPKTLKSIAMQSGVTFE